MHFDINTCSSCNGTGSKNRNTYHFIGTADIYNKPDWVCPACGGFGFQAKPVDDTYSMIENISVSFIKYE